MDPMLKLLPFISTHYYLLFLLSMSTHGQQFVVVVKDLRVNWTRGDIHHIYVGICKERVSNIYMYYIVSCIKILHSGIDTHADL